MDAKKWCLGLFGSAGALILLIATIVIYVDPYAHYHAPIVDMDYSASKIYINDGITRNSKYEAIITGSSTSRGFRAEEAEVLFGKKFICVPFPAEAYKKVSDNLSVGFRENKDLNMVIWGLDPKWFVAEPDLLAYEDYPEYLYDDDLWNDVNYLLNGDVLLGEIIRPLCSGQTSQEESADLGYDDTTSVSGDKKDSAGEITALNNYDRPPKENQLADESETEEMIKRLEQNLEKNVISRIEEQPDATFYIFFPPYSILWWDSVHQAGDEILNRRLYMEQFVIEQLLEYDNVRLFSFADNYDLTCNLSNYIDDVHYTTEVCTQILYWIKEGKYRLEKDNYREYLKNISDFYFNYDYDSIWKAHTDME